MVLFPIVRAIRIAAIWLSLAACLAYPAFARPKTDVIVMKNGDRITGEVKKLENGVLTVDIDYVDGSISVDWLKVARLESTYLFLVQLGNGSVYSAKVVTPEAPAGNAVKFEIQPVGQESLVVDRSTVVALTQTSESLWQRFNGNIALGATYSKGNSNTQYNLGSSLNYRATRWGENFTFGSNLSSSTGATAATRNQAALTAYRLLPWKNYYYAGTADFLQSSVQGIQRQTEFAGGIGRFLINNNRAQLTLFGGAGWQTTHYVPSDEPHESQNVAVAVISSDLNLFIFKKTRLTINGSVLPAVSGPGRLFAKVNASYYLKVFGKIDWNLSFYGNWDTRPPANLPSSDYGTSTGLSYSFGNH